MYLALGLASTSIAMLRKRLGDVEITLLLGPESVPPLYFWNREPVDPRGNRHEVEAASFSVGRLP